MAKIKMEPSENISVTSKEVEQVKETLQGKAGIICYNLGDNRKKRRDQMRAEIVKDRLGKDDDRPFINNRGNAGKKVFKRMAYFHMSVGAKRFHLNESPATQRQS